MSDPERADGALPDGEIALSIDDHPAENIRTCLRHLARKLVDFLPKLPDHYDPDVYDRYLRSLTALSRMVDRQFGPSLPPKTRLSGSDQQREDDALRAKLEDAVASVCRERPRQGGDRQADGAAAAGPGVDDQ